MDKRFAVDRPKSSNVSTINPTNLTIYNNCISTNIDAFPHCPRVQATATTPKFDDDISSNDEDSTICDPPNHTTQTQCIDNGYHNNMINPTNTQHHIQNTSTITSPFCTESLFSNILPNHVSLMTNMSANSRI